MRMITAVLAMACVLGCDDFREVTSTDRKLAVPPGIASLEDIEAVDAAAGDGRAAGRNPGKRKAVRPAQPARKRANDRSEEHTSELQSH